MPGGPRFNQDMSNEERRAKENLVLLCGQHHVETHDEDEWPVEKMAQMKSEHEDHFRGTNPAIPASVIGDITNSVASGEPQNLTTFGQFVDSDLTPEQNRQTLEDYILPLVEGMSKIPPKTRSLLSIVIDRGEPFDGGIGLPVDELEQVTGLGRNELRPHFDTMAKYGVARITEDYDFDNPRDWAATFSIDGWCFWDTLAEFCEFEGLQMSDFVRDLRFDLLD